MYLEEEGKTWFFDIDGTILRHNGYKDNNEHILPGVIEFMKKCQRCAHAG